MYQVGGVYLDIKSTLTRPLDEVLRPDDRYLLSHWRNKPGEEFEGWGLWPELSAVGGEFQQWHIVATSGHPFLRAVILRVVRNITRYNPVLDGHGWSGVIRTTGPFAYTLAVQPIRQAHQHRLVDAHAELGFRFSVYLGAEDHKGLFRSHYTELREPVVRLTTADKLLTSALIAAKAAKARLGAWRRVPVKGVG